jgi:hypothetical protein
MIIVATVDKYLVNNVHTDYDDGTFEWFDTTKLRIEDPPELAGKFLYVDHNEPQPPGSPWREAGGRLRLELRKGLDMSLGKRTIELFSAGIRILSDSLVDNQTRP